MIVVAVTGVATRPLLEMMDLGNHFLSRRILPRSWIDGGPLSGLVPALESRLERVDLLSEGVSEYLYSCKGFALRQR